MKAPSRIHGSWIDPSRKHYLGNRSEAVWDTLYQTVTACVTVALEKPLRVKHQFRSSHFRDKILFVSAQN